MKDPRPWTSPYAQEVDAVDSTEQNFRNINEIDEGASLARISEGEVGDPDGESIDDLAGDDAVLERGRQMLADAEAKLAGVERALARLDAGNYGRCEVCGAPIAASLLAERPSLDRCAEHDNENVTRA